MQRRQFLLVGGLCTVSMAGCLGGEAPPDEVAEAFITAVDDLQMSEARDLLHDDSPMGSPSDRFSSIIGMRPDSVDIEVTSAEVTEETADTATVFMTVAVEMAVPTGNQDIDFAMQYDDEWLVWQMFEPEE